jgi:4'-phosphopantetheinyl transferase
MWSAKESALKALRSGLRADTRSVVVEVPGSIESGRAGKGWQPLSVTESATRQQFTGWWRSVGRLVLTAVADKRFGPPLLQRH